MMPERMLQELKSNQTMGSNMQCGLIDHCHRISWPHGRIGSQSTVSSDALLGGKQVLKEGKILG
jgi:hypothetical protein